MLDLCKLFGVKEGEEFKIYGYEAIYFIENGYLYYIDIDSIKKKSYLIINDIAGENIINFAVQFFFLFLLVLCLRK